MSKEAADGRVWSSFSEANGSFVVYFKVGCELEFGPCADPLVSKSYMMTDGEFLSWRDSTEWLFMLSQHPFVCLSLFALSLSSCHSLPGVGVHAFLPGLNPCLSTSPGMQREDTEHRGWVMQSRQSRLCWQPPQSLLLASLALLYKNFLLSFIWDCSQQ